MNTTLRTGPRQSGQLAALHAGLAALALAALALPSAAQAPELERATDRAWQLAAEQLDAATHERGPTGGTAYWTSQPGAIRTYRPDGSLSRVYKLYSAPQPVAANVAEVLADVPADWGAHPARFVDLNAPTTSPDGAVVHPIVDPTSDAEGFSFTPAAATNPLPMPVRWVYQLRDGSLGFLDASNRFSPTAGGRAPSQDNPIVARFAFWSDDCTCKINVNTASEGVFWDTPRCDTNEERAYGRYQPAANEHQRAMGHPAAVSLSSVLFPGKRYHLPSTTSRFTQLTLDQAKQLWRLTPGLTDRGSEGGTQRVPPGTPATTIPIAGFRENPTELAAATDLDSDARTRAAKGDFFLTARSRAPDYTASGLPRLSLWPVDQLVYPFFIPSGGPSPASRSTRFDVLSFARCASPSPSDARNVVRRSSPQNQRSEFSSLGNHYVFNALRLSMRAPLWGLVDGARPTTGFESKYGPMTGGDGGAIELLMIDYLHAANPTDPTLGPGNRFSSTGQVSPFDTKTASENAATWFVSTNGNPRGLGRFPTVSEVSLVVVCRAAQSAGSSAIAGRFSTGHRTQAAALAASGLDVHEFDVALVVEGFTPAHSPAELIPTCSFQLAGGSGSRLIHQSLGQAGASLAEVALAGQSLIVSRTSSGTDGPPDGTSRTPASPIGQSIRRGGQMGVSFLQNAIRFDPLLITSAAGEPLPPFQFSGTGPHLRLFVFDTSNGAQISSNALDVGNHVQTIQLAFPSIAGSLPMPGEVGPPLQDRFVQLQQDASLGQAQIIGPRGLVRAGDIIQSLVPVHGDYRLVAAGRAAMGGSTNVVADFVAHPDFGSVPQAHSWRESDPRLDAGLLGVGTTGGFFPADVSLSAAVAPDYPISPHAANPIRLFTGFLPTSLANGALLGGQETTATAAAALDSLRLDLRTAGDPAAGFIRGTADPAVTGDFDNGIARTPDGAYINTPDPGDARAFASDGTPYFDNLTDRSVDNPGTFSPVRILPSAVMLGSLPTGVAMRVPWQSLLFRPDPNAGTPNAHFGATAPHDHYLLDFFRMPIVDPATPVVWARPGEAWTPSDEFSTAGRINLNYQILPFAAVRRATALHALFKAQKLLAIPDTAGPVYKSGAGDQPWRHFIDAEETLRQWESRFASGDCFRVPSEICEQWLVPEGESLDTIKAFWAQHRLTGDNSKERPYANIYPHLTTRSNTFQVHIVAQTIAKAEGSPVDGFDPEHDSVTGERRTAVFLESRIDPDNPSMPNYLGRIAGSADPIAPQETLDNFREISVVRTREQSAAVPVEITEVGLGPDSSLTLRWRCRNGQACQIEESRNLVTWLPLLIATTGVAKPNPSGEPLMPASPDEGALILPIPAQTVPLESWFVRVRALHLPP